MQTKTQITRRGFLVKAGATAALTAAGKMVLPVESVSAASLLVRRNVGEMTAFDPVIAAYSAVTAMRLLPANDPRNWAYQ